MFPVDMILQLNFTNKSPLLIKHTVVTKGTITVYCFIFCALHWWKRNNLQLCHN